MNYEHLSEVNRLSEKLKEKSAYFRRLRSALTGRSFVRMDIGGDEYGNRNLNIRQVILISESVDAKRIITEQADKVWSDIILIRTKLRELGVNLDKELTND